MAESPIDSLPLVAAVTGHRDLVDADRPAVREQVAACLLQLEKQSASMQRILLSALAEGADQLAAEVAMDRGWQLVAVLPRPASEYELDFAEGDARQRFHALLARCAAVHVAAFDGTLDADISSANDQQYRNAAVAQARHAHAVIALWDGQPGPAEPCGTAWMVGICREGLPPPPGEVLAAPDTVPVLHVPVRRSLNPANSPSKPDAHLQKTAIARLREYRAFALASAAFARQFPDAVSASFEGLLPRAARSSIDPGTLRLARWFATADALAIARQRVRTRIVRAASAAMVAGAFAQAAYSSWAQPAWLVAYALMAAIAYALYLALFRWARFRVEDRYLEYRALAEGCRVQVFWRIAGRAEEAADHYLQLVKSEVGWVRLALRATTFSLPDPPADSEGWQLARKAWVENQSGYFAAKAAACARMQRRYQRVSGVALAAGAALVAIAIAASLYAPWVAMKAPAFAFSTAFFVLGGVIQGYSAAMGYGEQAVSYARSSAVFKQALAMLASQPARTGECLVALGRFALAENADWLVQRRRNAFRMKR